jgi:ankyrin repeat protein
MNEKDGKHPFLKAAADGNVELLKNLLENGTDVNMQDENGWTALMEATWADQTEAVRFLLNKQADARIRNKDGYTSLMYASIWGKIEIMDMLKKAWQQQ